MAEKKELQKQFIRPLPIGIEDFEEMITKKCFYIDKTLLIKDLIDDVSKVSLFTRPRRFGKTLNISMIQRFFENTEYFARKDYSHLFDGLKIMDEGEHYTSHMHQYPIINLSLKSAKMNTLEESMRKMKELLWRELVRHSYILESKKIEEIQKGKYKKLLDEEATIGEYSNSLAVLSKCLEQHYEKKVIILIDEYDVPLENAYFCGFYDEMVDFIRSLLGDALKTNESLEFAVLTGCLRISKESIFTGLNNLDIISILSKKYDEYFGFTEQEVEETLKEYHIEKNIDVVTSWYNGYVFGNANVYNPWSFIKYVRDAKSDVDCRPAPHWSNTSSNDIIRKLIDMAGVKEKKEIEMLIQGETITKEIHEDITYGDIDSSMDNLWNFLFFTGYLKKVSEDFREETLYLALKIPNREIMYIYKRKISEWMKEKVYSKKYTTLYESILQGDAKGIQDELNACMTGTISYFDSYENFYHGFLVGLLMQMEYYDVKSNRESGDGRSDIFLTCDISDEIAVIIEVKSTKSFDLLEKSCDEALRQMEEKNYDEEIKSMGYKKIIKYGIAFCKKRCEVKID